MINFRYHLVSLTAVFLALTVGLILGTAALNGPALDRLQESTQTLRDSNEQLRAQVGQMETDLEDDQAFAEAVAPSYLAGQLTGKNVLVIALPGADTSYVDGAIEKLGYAGATVSGRISILDDYFDPANAGTLGDLVENVTPDTITTPVTYDGVTAMSYVLGAVTTGVAAGAPVTVAPGDITTVTTGLNDLGMLTVETPPTGVADGILILAGSGSTDSDAADRNAGMVAFTDEFAADGPTVYAATTATGDGNPIKTLRADSAETVATVDNVNLSQGQVAAVAALADYINTDTVNHLGTGEGASDLLPAAA